MIARIFRIVFLPCFLSLFFLSIHTPLLAKTLITGVTINQSASEQTIILSLENRLQPDVRLDKGAGWLRMDIKDAEYTGQEKNFSLEGGFLSNIKIYQIGNDVLFEILFSDIFYTPNENRFRMQNIESQLVIQFSLTDKFPSPDAGNTQTADITVAQKLNIPLDNPPNNPGINSSAAKNDPSADTAYTLPSGFTEFDYDLKANMFNLLLGLLLLLGLGYAILYFLNRYGFKKYRINHEKYNINVLNTKALGPKQKIVIVEINNKKFACGVTKDQINYLTLIPDEMEREFDALLKTPQMTVPALRTIFIKQRNEHQIYHKEDQSDQPAEGDVAETASNQNSQSSNTRSRRKTFQEEFFSKIKNLKKIQ